MSTYVHLGIYGYIICICMWFHNNPESSTKRLATLIFSSTYLHGIESSWLTLENLNRTTWTYSTHWKRTLSTYVIMHTPITHQHKWFYCQLYIQGSLENPSLLPCLLAPRGPMWLTFTCKVFMLEPCKLALTCMSGQLGMMTEFSYISVYISMIRGYSRNYLILSSWGLTDAGDQPQLIQGTRRRDGLGDYLYAN